MQPRRLSATEIIQSIRSRIPTARSSRHYIAPQNKEIARELHISERTVKFHSLMIFRRPIPPAKK